MRRLTWLTLFALFPLGCEVYDPPPKAKITQPRSGKWTLEDPVELVFTEPIDPRSLKIDIREAIYDREGYFLDENPPIIRSCTLDLGSGPSEGCGDLEMILSEAQDSVEIFQNGMLEPYEGEPLVIIVRAGLKDLAGRERKVDSPFPYQLSPLFEFGDPIDVDLGTGVFTLAAELDGLGLNGIYLRMAMSYGVNPDNGDMKVIGTYARLHNADGVTWPPNYSDPDGYEAVLDDMSWVRVFDARIVKSGENTYYFESDPFDVSINLLNAIPITLAGFTVSGTFRLSDDPQVRSTVSGTLSTTGGEFGVNPVQVDPISPSWRGSSYFADEIEENLPSVCMPDPCDYVDRQGGDCQVPKPWDHETYCQ